MTPSLAPLEARGISQRFGRKRVLKKVDLRLDAGEIVGLVGANGAGKTTLFSILTGLLPADEGERRLAGAPFDDLSLERRARFAYVAHRPQIYLGLSARENLDLYASLRATVGAETEASAAVLARFGLADAAEL
ncbi:MAG: ATP-binding cassette domain-containing protein, partial [Dehalococcoidia bacterium]|nr:ATP-binding cassette domain-containing protein [Dehalococcoidia bacterium]